MIFIAVYLACAAAGCFVIASVEDLPAGVALVHSDHILYNLCS